MRTRSLSRRLHTASAHPAVPDNPHFLALVIDKLCPRGLASLNCVNTTWMQLADEVKERYYDTTWPSYQAGGIKDVEDEMNEKRKAHGEKGRNVVPHVHPKGVRRLKLATRHWSGIGSVYEVGKNARPELRSQPINWLHDISNTGCVSWRILATCCPLQRSGKLCGCSEFSACFDMKDKMMKYGQFRSVIAFETNPTAPSTHDITLAGKQYCEDECVQWNGACLVSGTYNVLGRQDTGWV
eukprot:jgi/Chlat1/1009/Chrsp109S08622